MDIVLIAGLWLPAAVWGDVADRLRALGHRPVAVALPGQDGAATASLDDQIAAVLAAVDQADHPVVVGHSAAATLAWLAADRRPADITRAVFIGGFPTSDGGTYADFFDLVDGMMPFPGWDAFDDADVADLDDTTRDRFVHRAVPVAGSVSTATVHYANPRRRDVPVTLVCPEFSPNDARAWISKGDIPELARTAMTYADLDSGHWPMITAPDTLARLLSDAATDLETVPPEVALEP